MASADQLYSCAAGDNRAGCNFYQPRHTEPAALAAASAAGQPVPLGHCWRYPTPVVRAPGDLCGEHSALLLLRLKLAAER